MRRLAVCAAAFVAAPFVVVLLILGLATLTGLPWGAEAAAITTAVGIILGIPIGGILAGLIWVEGIKIGHLDIGKVKRDD